MNIQTKIDKLKFDLEKARLALIAVISDCQKIEKLLLVVREGIKIKGEESKGRARSFYSSAGRTVFLKTHKIFWLQVLKRKLACSTRSCRSIEEQSPRLAT